ncbi:hypothetical protein JCGZ_23767 [Jatropha curcas]|uniref:Protein kinase domain-containing protein n=1 Tax=Jatropha curcas TaxID=180498 RepID=A0A067LE94_JATCU|nr:rust resistance kinase Lr10 [Jatropha curcas]KDP42825.1 hypothetical protein JCGZ_23767 [Jatropha curcas]
MVIYSKEIVIYFFCLFSYSVVLACGSHRLTSTVDCNIKSCASNGPPVRFPFRIKDKQPVNCGYPEAGFVLSCSEKNETVLELPYSKWKLFIEQIDYKSQVIFSYRTEACVATQILDLDSNISPFKFKEGNKKYRQYTLFNCSSAYESYEPISCLSGNLQYRIYAIPAYYHILGLDLLRCVKIHDISQVKYDYLYNDILHLSWVDPRCGSCEAKGKYCRLKSNTTGFETECYGELKGSSRKHITIGVILGSILLAAAASLLYRLYSSKKRDREYQSKIEKFLDDYKSLKPTRYSYADIKRVTNQFKEELGQGAYGTVFKGKLSDEILVAVKLLNNSTGNGEEFVDEVATIGKIHHVNVVRLIGFCADGFIRALVYEYLPNDSLQKYITSADNSNKNFLGWKRLQDITLGIAKGIEYLHQGCDQRILHFDIKPHNILLDHDFNPKVSDFGLAKFCAKDQSAVSMTTARGTIGYIAPEVFSRNFGNVSYKSDVYSFGMLVLEMVGGRKNVEATEEGDDEQIYFPEWIYNLLEEGDDLRFEIEEEGDTKIAKKLAVVGLWCIQWNPVDRPSMKVVVHMLEGEGENLPVPPNPFSSGTSTRTNARIAGRLLHRKLEAISEIE